MIARQPAGEVTQLLVDLENGDRGAASSLMPLVYDELRALAQSLFSMQSSDHTLQPTAVVHEAYLKLLGPEQSDHRWVGRDHFFCVAAQAMRHVLISHARAKNARKRGGGDACRTLIAVGTGHTPCPTIDLLVLEEALSDLELRDERQCRIVEMRFFGGLSNERIATILGLSVRTIQLEWKMASAWLAVWLSEHE